MLTPLLTLRGHTDSVYSVAIHPNGVIAATGSLDRVVTIWDLATGKPLQSFNAQQTQGQGHTGQVLAVAFSPQGDLVASAGSDNQVRLWDMPQPWLEPLAGVVGLLPLGKDAQRTAANKMPRSLVHAMMVDSLAFDPTGKFLATGCHDGNLRIWEMAKGTTTKSIVAHTLMAQGLLVQNPIYAVAWLPDGKQVISASYDRSSKLWDVASGNLVREFKGAPDPIPSDKPKEKPTGLLGHRDQVFTLALSKDGKTMATGSSDRTIKLWDVASGKVIREFMNPDMKPDFAGEPSPSHPGWVQAIAFTPDGKKLVSVGPAAMNRGYLAVWSVPDGKRLAAFETDLGPLFSVAITTDGSKLLLGCGPKERRESSAEAVMVKMPA